VTKLSVLERRMAAIEDRSAIVDRIFVIAHAVDYGGEDAFVDSFTPDAVFAVYLRGEDRPTHVYAGHAGLRARIQNHTRPPELYHKHVYLNPLVTVEGDEARSDCYYLVIAEHAGEPELLAFGRNRDRLARCADGQWRVRERNSEMEVRSALPVWTVRSAAPGASGAA
jgi:hypothetical protein